MYTLSKNLKLIPIILMIVGAIGLAVGFFTTPGSVEEVKEMLAHDSHHGGGHGDTHKPAVQSEGHVAHAAQADHHADDSHERHIDDADTHAEHVFHQLQNKPWAALYVAAFFFFMIALGVLAFYAIQYAAQAGWSPLLLRVMEGITAYLLPGGVIMFIILALSAFHFNHLFVWADHDLINPENPKYDALIAGKSSWLNAGWFLVRAAVFLIGWNLYRIYAVKFSRKQDEDPNGNVWYKKSFKAAAGFLVFFIYTESMMSWDWIMSFDPHWFSTLSDGMFLPVYL